MVHQLPGFELTHGAAQEHKNKSCLPYPFSFWVLITGSYQRRYWILLVVLLLLKSMDTTQGRPARERPGVLLFTSSQCLISTKVFISLDRAEQPLHAGGICMELERLVMGSGLAMQATRTRMKLFKDTST